MSQIVTKERERQENYMLGKNENKGIYIYIYSDSMLLPCRAACGQRTVRRRISGIQLNKLAPSSHKTKRTDTIFTNNGIPALIGKF